MPWREKFRRRVLERLAEVETELVKSEAIAIGTGPSTSYHIHLHASQLGARGDNNGNQLTHREQFVIGSVIAARMNRHRQQNRL
jgi:hypothetical protein